MMKAGRCPLPWEECSFQAASPSPLHCPRLAATAAAPRRAARCLSKPRAENIRHCNHRVWFCFHPTVGSGPFQLSPISCLCSSFILPALFAASLRRGEAEECQPQGPRCLSWGGCSQLCCWRGLLWFGAVAQTRPWHRHGAEPDLGSLELSTMHRAEGTPLLAGTGQEWKERCQESPIPWGQRGCPSASTLSGGCTSLSMNLAPSPGPTASTGSLAGQTDVAQPKNHSSHGGKVMPAAPGWTRVPVGEMCQGCHSRLCHSPLLAAALLTLLSPAEHH